MLNLMDPNFRGGETSIKVLDEQTAYALNANVGQRVMLALTPSDVHDPTEIATYLAGYKNAEYMADHASPVILRDTDNDKYRTFDEDNTYLRVDVKGSIQGSIPEIDPKSSLASYAVVDRFVGSFVPSVTEQNETAYSARQQAAKRCSRAIGMDREIDVLGTGGILTTAAGWHASVKTTLIAGTKWNGGVTSDPIANLQTAAEASLSPLTDGYMNLTVANAFFNNSATQAHLQFHLGDSGSRDVLKSFYDQSDSGNYEFTIPGLFGIKFHVLCAKFKETTTSTPAYIMPNHCILTRRPAGTPTDGEDIATSYTYRRRGPANVGWEMRSFRVEGRGPKGGTMIVCAQADIAIMTGPKIGYGIFDAVQ